MLSAQIVPRLKRDFLRDLPIELGLHVLSFVSPSSLHLTRKYVQWLFEGYRWTIRSLLRGLH
jgi:hypothetical protein